MPGLGGRCPLSVWSLRLTSGAHPARGGTSPGEGSRARVPGATGASPRKPPRDSSALSAPICWRTVSRQVQGGTARPSVGEPCAPRIPGPCSGLGAAGGSRAGPGGSSSYGLEQMPGPNPPRDPGPSRPSGQCLSFRSQVSCTDVPLGLLGSSQNLPWRLQGDGGLEPGGAGWEAAAETPGVLQAQEGRGRAGTGAPHWDRGMSRRPPACGTGPFCRPPSPPSSQASAPRS